MSAVSLATTQQELFVGSFTELLITIDPGSGLVFDDLDFVVPDGLAGGLVSPPGAETSNWRNRC